MSKTIKKIAVMTSGGDSPGMNAAIRSVARTCAYYNIECAGIYRGYEGMIEGDFMNMTAHSVSGIIQQGGTMLQSARSERFRTKEGRAIAYQHLQQQGIEGIVAIGGDGTFSGASVFMQEYDDIAMVGCAGTIDNDLYGTDFTIGYDTAINTAMNAIDNVKDTANAHNRLFFIEVMGRDAGFIALRSAIASGAEAVLVPESRTDIEKLVETLKNNYQNKKRASIVIVAEGDDAGGAFKIAEEVKKRIDYFDIRVTVLGHVQRGGRPTAMERVRASRLGMAAVDALLDGKKGVMIGELHREISYTPFEKATKHHQKMNPMLLEMVDILS